MKKLFLIALLITTFATISQALPFAWANMIQPKSLFGASTPRAIKYDNGYIYVFGSFKDTIDLDMGNGTKYVNAYDANNISGYLAKYDLQGNFIWGGSLKGIKTGNPNCPAPPYNEILDMAFDASHNVYIIGYYDDSVRFEFGGIVKGLRSPCGVSEFILKLNPAGDVITASQVTGMQCPTYFSGSGIVLDQANGLYAITDFYGTGDFDFSAGTKIYDHQIYSKFNVVVSRYNRNTMALEWSGMLASNKTLYGEKVLVDANKNMYVSGKFVGEIDIDFSPAVHNITNADSSHFDYFIIKYDSNGVYQWVNQFTYGGSFDFDVTMDNSNHLLIAGSFKDHITVFHNNINQANLISNGAANDLFCVKMDLNGNTVWAKRIGGTYQEYYQGISVAGNNNIMLNGWFNLATSIDPVSMTNDYVSASMATNGLLSCLSPNGDLVFGGVTNAQFNGNMGGSYYTCSVWDPSGNLYLAGVNLWQSDINPDTNANASNVLNNPNNSFNSFVMKLGSNVASNITDKDLDNGVICFPSPARSFCIIQSKHETISSVGVYNSMGQCMTMAHPQNKTYRLDLQNYNPGLYYIQYTLQNSTGYTSILVTK